MIDRLLSFIAPHRCYGCEISGSILCNSCYNDIVESDFGRCIWCLLPADGMDQCRLCGEWLGVSGAWAIGERNGILKSLVGDYKYESIRESGLVMARLLDQRVAVLPADTIVTSIPTVAQHIRQRGFDHAGTIAREFSSLRNLHYTPLLRRLQQTPQHELSRAARLKAAKQAFELKTTSVGSPILLIDDIMTTGATLEACVRLLQDSGATEIYAAIVARQMLEQER